MKPVAVKEFISQRASELLLFFALKLHCDDDDDDNNNDDDVEDDEDDEVLGT